MFYLWFNVLLVSDAVLMSNAIFCLWVDVVFLMSDAIFLFDGYNAILGYNVIFVV